MSSKFDEFIARNEAAGNRLDVRAGEAAPSSMVSVHFFGRGIRGPIPAGVSIVTPGGNRRERRHPEPLPS